MNECEFVFGEEAILGKNLKPQNQACFRKHPRNDNKRNDMASVWGICRFGLDQ